HKTGVVAEQLLVRVLKRAKFLVAQGVELPASNSLTFFLQNEIGLGDFSKEVLKTFSKLDDSDVLSSMKSWVEQEDFVLKNLCEMLLNRDLLKVKVKSKPFSQRKIEMKRNELIEYYGISKEEASY